MGKAMNLRQSGVPQCAGEPSLSPVLARRPGTSMALAIGFALGLAALVASACKGRPETGQREDSASSGVTKPSDAAAGCRDNAACSPGQYCAFEPELCGKGRKPGTCRVRPRACTGFAFSPVCGCDGKVYDNECAAHAAAVDLAVMGGCGTRMPSFIPCGKQLCDARKDYCAIYLSDVFDLPTDYFCRPLPASCLPGDGSMRRVCECFPSEVACRSFCGVVTTDGLPGFHLTCQGVHPRSEDRTPPPDAAHGGE